MLGEELIFLKMKKCDKGSLIIYVVGGGIPNKTKYSRQKWKTNLILTYGSMKVNVPGLYLDRTSVS